MNNNMKIRILACAVLASAALVSCQEKLIERRVDGHLALRVENSPVVETVTKAGEEDVNTDNFTVYIVSTDASHSESDTYANYQAKGTIKVPAGNYTVSAENVTDAVAHPAEPLGWGQPRYYGISEEKPVTAGPVPTPFEVTCRMANTALSVVFDASVEEYFSDYQVVAYVDEGRKLTYDEQTTTIGYFGSGKNLYYDFSGTYKKDSQTKTIKGHYSQIAPATHLHLTFKIKEQPEEDTDADMGISIEVITDCEDLYRNVTVDPSDGSYEEEDIVENGNQETK